MPLSFLLRCHFLNPLGRLIIFGDRAMIMKNKTKDDGNKSKWESTHHKSISMRTPPKVITSAIIFLLLSATAMLLITCATQTPAPAYHKDGKAYGVTSGNFRHRWWNYYERGLSYAEGQYYEEAANDLKSAITKRDLDQRMARSYGMHFIDYFPHRELGVIYYYQEKYDLAEAELDKSLSTVDTGKAKHYLNLCRMAKLKQSELDKAKPSITVASLSPKKIFNAFTVEIKGEVEDDFFVRRISINEEPEFIELSSKKIPFYKTIKLKKGPNKINIRSADLLGKTTEKHITLVGDFEGPSLILKNVADGDEVGQDRIVLYGTLADDSGINSFTINSNKVVYNNEKEVEFGLPVDLNEGENQIKIVASDLAGNVTSGELTLSYSPHLANIQSLSNDDNIQSATRHNPIQIAASGTVISDAGSGLHLAAANAFRLNFKDLSDIQTVYYRTIFVDGNATGTHDIKSVTINGNPLLIKRGRTVFFSQIRELNEGENLLTIMVTDVRGNAASKSIRVIRKTPTVHKIGSRMSLAILPFEIKGEPTRISDVVYDNLINAFVRQKRFNIIARGDELAAVLQEQKLSQTDLVDKSTATRIGKLVAAESILMGTIRESRNSIEIYARLINTETSSILEAKDVYGQDISIPHIQYLINGLALKLKHSFPLVEGMVLRVKDNEIYADFGTFKHIKKEMRFIVFKHGEIIFHPLTGKPLGSETEELGVATVVEVFEEMSIGKLVADFKGNRIQVQDLVITK